MPEPATLRRQLRDIATGCEWPECERPGAEVAHLRSRGMGGTPDGRRNVLSNVAWLCYDHARMSDGHQPRQRSPVNVERSYVALLGADVYGRAVVARTVSYERTEALRRHVADVRGWAADD